MTTKAEKEAQREEAIAELKEILKPGDDVYTLIRRVSSSGMSRCIDVYFITDNQPRWLSRYVAKALQWTYDEKTESVRVGGCGMDMGFHLIHSLSYALFGDGYSLNQRWL